MKKILVTQNLSRPNFHDAVRDPKPGFGKHYGDHMFTCEIIVEDWKNDFAELLNPEIKPFSDISISPACFGLHYAQAAFEGMLAFKDETGNMQLFRPDKNYIRFNDSMARVGIPRIREKDFIKAVEELILIDRDWVSRDNLYSLYIRPIIFCEEDYIGVRQENNRFRLIIITTLNASYQAGELELYVPRRIHNGISREFVRTVSGGTGSVKASANYAGTIPAIRLAKDNNCNDVLWIDPITNNNIDEIGTNNVFFFIGDKIVTPELNGSILPGITRDSAITLLREFKFEVEEREISLSEIIEAYHDKELREAFATGTASSVKPILKIDSEDQMIQLSYDTNSVSMKLKTYLDEIKWSKTSDKYGWIHKIKR